jgi:hypothetical protein
MVSFAQDVKTPHPSRLAFRQVVQKRVRCGITRNCLSRDFSFAERDDVLDGHLSWQGIPSLPGATDPGIDRCNWKPRTRKRLQHVS